MLYLIAGVGATRIFLTLNPGISTHQKSRGSVTLLVQHIQVFCQGRQQVMESSLGVWSGQDGVQQPCAH